MNPRAASEIAFYVGLLPALAAFISYRIIRFTLPDAVARRYAPAGALAIGVLLGFFLLPSTETLAPVQFYEWIAHLGIGAAVVSGLSLAEGVSRAERLVAMLLTCWLAAWFLVPTWPDQIPPQHFHVVLVGLGMFLLAALLEPLPARLPGRALPLFLMLGGGAVAMVMMAEVGETLGRLAGLAAGALFGCAVAVLRSKREIDLRSLALPYAVIVGAYAFTGYVYPSTPLYLILLLPFVPLALWLCAAGPLKRLEGAKAFAAQAGCVLIPLAIIVAIVLVRGSGGSEDW